MTAVAEVATEPLFTTEHTLFPFQIEAAATSFWRWTDPSSDEPAALLLYDTGIGKTVISIAALAMMIEDGLVDRVVVVAEANKVLDWVTVDFPKFAPLVDVQQYKGDPARRKRILAKQPQVLVMGYQTGRNDIGTMKKVGKVTTKAWESDGPLMEYLVGQRSVIVFDEFSVLRNRGSQTYVMWDHLLKRMRKAGPEPRIIGLTATTVESGAEDHWNACRLLSPRRAGTVEAFDTNYVKVRDSLSGKAKSFKNLTASDCEPGVIPLNRMFAGITLRKSKFDDDVIDHFPKKVEEPPTIVPLDDGHWEFYQSVEEIYRDPDLDEETQRTGFSLLRTLAAHPMALLRSNGKAARQIVEAVGAPYLERLTSAKVQAMLDWQATMERQQTVIFTFYGQSVLPLLEFRLGQEGYRVSVNHGQMSGAEKQHQKDRFLAGETQIFLSSDAGAKGLNLGCGSALLHYESPLTYATYVQRSDRIHRIDSRHPSVTINTLIAKGTVEEAISEMMLKRNDIGEKVQDADWSEDYEPTEGVLRASDRLRMFRRAR